MFIKLLLDDLIFEMNDFIDEIKRENISSFGNEK
jgi:hypothetical protein